MDSLLCGGKGEVFLNEIEVEEDWQHYHGNTVCFVSQLDSSETQYKMKRKTFLNGKTSPSQSHSIPVHQKILCARRKLSLFPDHLIPTTHTVETLNSTFSAGLFVCSILISLVPWLGNTTLSFNASSGSIATILLQVWLSSDISVVCMDWELTSTRRVGFSHILQVSSSGP